MCEQSYRRIKRKIVGLIYLKYLKRESKNKSSVSGVKELKAE